MGQGKRIGLNIFQARELIRLKRKGVPHAEIRALFPDVPEGILDHALARVELTPAQRHAIMRMLDRGETPERCAAVFGVTKRAVIWTRENWVGALTYRKVCSAAAYKPTVEGVQDVLGSQCPPAENVKRILNIRHWKGRRLRAAERSRQLAEREPVEQTPEQKARVAAYLRKTGQAPVIPPFAPYEPRF